jgi:hypothetical protein
LLPALAGCPASTRFLVADVTSAHAPVEGALVAADCGQPRQAALRTDDTGRARLSLFGAQVDAARCVLTVAKPGYATVETGGANLCTSGACTPMRVELAATQIMEVAR